MQPGGAEPGGEGTRPRAAGLGVADAFVKVQEVPVVDVNCAAASNKNKNGGKPTTLIRVPHLGLKNRT